MGTKSLHIKILQDSVPQIMKVVTLIYRLKVFKMRNSRQVHHDASDPIFTHFFDRFRLLKSSILMMLNDF